MDNSLRPDVSAVRCTAYSVPQQQFLAVLSVYVLIFDMKLFYFWPGARGIHRYGRWSFLLIAIAFSVLSCAMIFVHIHWTQLISNQRVQNLTIVIYVFIWLALLLKSSKIERKIRHKQRIPEPEKDIFRDAQFHYLQGNWFETECCLNMLLKRNARDVDAMLMMATLFRHIKRIDEAIALIKQLDLLEESHRLKYEIRSEKRKIMRVIASQKKSGQPLNQDKPTAEAAA